MTTSEVMRIQGERRGVLCPVGRCGIWEEQSSQLIANLLEPPRRWEAVALIVQMISISSCIVCFILSGSKLILRYFKGLLLRIVGWFRNICMLMTHALVKRMSHSECNVWLRHSWHIHLDHWLTVKSIESDPCSWIVHTLFAAFHWQIKPNYLKRSRCMDSQFFA